MDSCLFCKIAAKEEEAYIIYENEFVCCFLDRFPINNGHALVVPKRHFQEFTDVDADSLRETILAAQKMASVLESVLNCDGITVMQNNGIFKDIGHYHMHFVPRFKDDGFSWIEPEIHVEEKDFSKLHQVIRERLGLNGGKRWSSK